MEKSEIEKLHNLVKEFGHFKIGPQHGRAPGGTCTACGASTEGVTEHYCDEGTTDTRKLFPEE